MLAEQASKILWPKISPRLCAILNGRSIRVPQIDQGIEHFEQSSDVSFFSKEKQKLRSMNPELDKCFPKETVFRSG